MIEKIGVVESLDEEYATVVVKHEEKGCGSGCGSTGCHQPQEVDEEPRFERITALNKLDAEPGDIVRFEIPLAALLSPSLLAVPILLVVAIVGVFIGSVLHPNVMPGMPKALFSMIVGVMFFMIARTVHREINEGEPSEEEAELPIKIVEIIGREGDSTDIHSAESPQALEADFVEYNSAYDDK